MFLISGKKTIFPLLILILSACAKETGNQTEITASPDISAQIVKLTISQEIQTELNRIGFQTLKKEMQAPDFELENLSGQKVSLSSLRGKVIFLNFWATWCAPCRAEMPSIELLHNELKTEGFAIIAVNSQEEKKTVKNFIDEKGFTFTVLLDKTGRIGANYGVRGIPATYLIDRKGFLLARTVGTREWYTEEITSLFRDILEL